MPGRLRSWVRHRQTKSDTVGQPIEVTRRFRGKRMSFLLRPGTLDADLLDMILVEDGAYALPASVEPKVIFDVGGNIGVAACYFAAMYPQADVYCFEPLPDNLELLRHNASANSDRIRVIPKGLSDQEGTFTYHMSANPRSFGGGTFCGTGHDPSRAMELPLTTAANIIDELGLTSVDVFKIDTEGSEAPILRGVPEAIRKNAQAYVGELHGVEDWSFCQTLDPTHAVGVEKAFNKRCFPFMAIRRDLASRA